MRCIHVLYSITSLVSYRFVRRSYRWANFHYLVNCEHRASQKLRLSVDFSQENLRNATKFHVSYYLTAKYVIDISLFNIIHDVDARR